MPYSRSIAIIPAGVHGHSAASPCTILPTFTGWNASTSLSGEIAFMTLRSLICCGSGSCTRMPSTASSALSRATSSRSSLSDTLSGRSKRRLSMPHLTQSRSLLRTYISEAGSFPTSTAARHGRRGSPSASVFTRAQTFSASPLPSISFAISLISFFLSRFGAPTDTHIAVSRYRRCGGNRSCRALSQCFANRSRQSLSQLSLTAPFTQGSQCRTPIVRGNYGFVGRTVTVPPHSPYPYYLKANRPHGSWVMPADRAHAALRWQRRLCRPSRQSPAAEAWRRF